MAALVDWATYIKKTGTGFYAAVIPLTAGDWTDIVMPTGVTALLMNVAWEDDVTLSMVDKTGSPEVECVFDEEDDGVGGVYTFSQDMIQDATGINLRILDTSGGAQNVSVALRAIT